MAKFKIYSPAGTEIYEGTPSFTGQYMAPGLLEFREIASPVPLDLSAGCYVDYTRTGFRYRIYGVPQVKKQARQRSYGGAFIYQNVQLYDASKMLEFCPFRDLVKGDNRIHFSTQPSISTFEGVDGLARRFEACLQDQYGANSWRVRIATTDDGISQDLADLMADAREFTVSGVNILECLSKVYEIWPEVGWVYTVEEGIDTIIIGGAGLNANEGTYAYGKGFGLTSLTRTVANADEMANRIFAYGSSRNMLPRWYNNQNIKDAESVDIQNLMIPITEWGLTDVDGWLLPDASKAFVEDAASIAKIGLRPATVYFDGSGGYPEIYPSIRNATIGEVRTWIQQHGSSPKWSPSTEIYPVMSERVDVLKSAQSTFDSGLAGTDGKQTIYNGYQSATNSGADNIPAERKSFVQTILTVPVTFTASEAGTRNLKIALTIGGTIQAANLTGGKIVAYLRKGHPAAAETVTNAAELVATGTSGMYNLPSFSLSGSRVEIEAATYYLVVDMELDLEESATEQAYSYDIDCDLAVSLSQYRSKTFTVTLKQIGFDIAEQAALGDGKTISMRSGSCVGRTFAINSVQYNSATDDWTLECFRSEDESLSQWFPNTDYPVRAGDEFVLLDIAMPELYIGIASQKLLQAAREFLSDTATERWQYVPEIDAKYMVENNRTIRAGEWMAFLDVNADDITPTTITYFRVAGGGGYFYTSDNSKTILAIDPGSVVLSVVDTVTINEGEAAIPTYKVTLRDRKRKTWTESESAPTSSSKSVGSASSSNESSGQYIDLSGYVKTDAFESLSGRVATLESESFWMLDDDGNVTLKPQYENAWVPGWLAAGGVGSGSGGGGGVSYLKELTDIYHNANGVLRADGSAVQNGDALVYDSANSRWIAAAVSGGGGSITIDTDLSPTSGNAVANSAIYAALSGKQESLVSGTNIKTINGESILGSGDIQIQGGGGGGGTVTSITLTQGTGITVSNSGTAITTSGSRTISISSSYRTLINNGNTAYGWGNHASAGYLTASSLSGYATESWVSQQGFASASDLSSLLSRVASIEDWFEIETVNGQAALHVKQGRALYADSWIASGGVGSGSGGGGTMVVWGTKSGYTRPLTVEGVTETLLLDGALAGYATTAAMNTALAGKQNAYGFTIQGTSGATYNLANFLTASALNGYVTLSGDQTISGNKGFSGSIYGDLGGMKYWGIDNDGSAFFDNISVGGNQIDFSSFALKAGGTDYNFRVDSLIVSDGGTLDGTTYNGKPALRFAYRYTDESSMTPTIVSETKYLAYKDEIPTDYVKTSGAQQVSGVKTFLANVRGGSSASVNWQITTAGAAAFASLTVGGNAVNPSNYVTLDGAQTISGAKTFSAQLTASSGITLGGSILPASDSSINIGDSSHRFSGGNIRNLYVTTFYFVDGTTPSTMHGGIYCANGLMQLQLGANANGGHLTFGQTTGFFHSGNGSVPLGRSDHRWSNIYGVNADLSGNLSLASASHIDIGPLRIEYDATNKALHITKKDSNDTETYGLYADGFIAAGGVQQTS